MGILCGFACKQDEEGVASKLPLLEAEDPAVRRVALEDIARKPRTLDRIRLRRLLEDPAPAIRILALSIAARRGEDELVGWVGPRVEDPDPEVRRAALEALAAFSPEGRLPHLIAAFPLQDLATRHAIAEELGGSDEALFRLIREEARQIAERSQEALQEGGVAELMGALELLGRSGRPEALDLLVGLLESESTRVAIAAARALALGHDAGAAREPLEAMATSEHPERREAARSALRRLGLDPGEAPTEEDSAAAWDVVMAARSPLDERIEALEERGDVEALLKLFHASGSAHAAAALGRLGMSEAARQLLDPKSAGKVTPAWILSLQAVDEKLARRAARLHLVHDRPEIRAAAAEVLGGRCDWEAMPLLRALAAEDYFVEVRMAATAATQAIRSCI